jgi:hypothetical protein
VRLTGPDSGKGAAGKWTDAATGEHGDLLDLVALNRGFDRLCDALDEARSFLSLPRPALKTDGARHALLAPSGSSESARRLFAMSQPIGGTLAEAYLRARGITLLQGVDNLRFHPRCYYRPDPFSATETWPALIAAVTDLQGRITGVHRTWLDPSGTGKAPIDTPRRAMGNLLGHGVRFDIAGEPAGAKAAVLAAGEGIETMLSLRMALPFLPMIAALSANHLAAILFPPALRRLYVARDPDPAGDGAVERLLDRARDAGIDAIVLSPTLADFNDDLRQLGIDHLRAALHILLAPEDAAPFMLRPTAGTE